MEKTSPKLSATRSNLNSVANGFTIGALATTSSTNPSTPYRYLWSNAPKECLEFADYSFDEHFGKPIASYPPREVLAHYINGRIEKSGVKSWVKFNHVAHDVRWDEETKDFQVTVKRLSQNADGWTDQEDIVERFDYVYVCVGHFSVPNMPYFQGFEKFGGRILHSHDFKDAVEFAGQRALVVGTSYSSEDIASQMWKYGCKDITFSYRTKPMAYNWPEGFDTKPLISKVEGKTVHFIDGTSKEVDSIVLCTGYKHHYPFLETSLALKTKNRFVIDDCHQGIFWKNPRLMYIGM
jgi:trimethylamine monooxygenase